MQKKSKREEDATPGARTKGNRELEEEMGEEKWRRVDDRRGKMDGEGEERKEIEARLHFAGIAKSRLACAAPYVSST